MKENEKISEHRAKTFLLEKELIKNYSQLSQKKFIQMDELTGRKHWCDMSTDREWGECTQVFQSNREAKIILKDLFKLDKERFEKEYEVSITPFSQAFQEKKCYSYKLNTRESLKEALQKKLKKLYPYIQNNYSQKGLLLVGITQPVFNDFRNDGEISIVFLKKLRDDLCSVFKASSFKRVLLVNALSPFHENPEMSTYDLF